MFVHIAQIQRLPSETYLECNSVARVVWW